MSEHPALNVTRLVRAEYMHSSGSRIRIDRFLAP
jgi:hypothetical protein